MSSPQGLPIAVTLCQLSLLMLPPWPLQRSGFISYNLYVTGIEVAMLFAKWGGKQYML